MTCGDDEDDQSRNAGVGDALHLSFSLLAFLLLVVNLQLLCGTAYLKESLVRNRLMVLATSVVLFLVCLSLNVELSVLSPGQSWGVVVFSLMALHLSVLLAASYPYIITVISAAYINQQRPEERRARNKVLNRIATFWKWALIVFELCGAMLYSTALSSGNMWPMRFINIGGYMMGAIIGTLTLVALLDVRYFIFSQTRDKSAQQHNAWVRQLETNPELEALRRRFRIGRRNMNISMATIPFIVCGCVFNALKLAILNDPLCGKLRKTTTLDNTRDFLIYACVTLGLQIVLTTWVYTAKASLNPFDLCFCGGHCKDPATVCHYYCTCETQATGESIHKSRKLLSDTSGFEEFRIRVDSTQTQSKELVHSPFLSALTSFGSSLSATTPKLDSVVLGSLSTLKFPSDTQLTEVSTVERRRKSTFARVKVLIYGFDGVLSAFDEKRLAAVSLGTARTIRRHQLEPHFGGAERVHALKRHLEAVHETGCLMFVHTTDTCSDKIFHVLYELDLTEPFLIRERDRAEMKALLLPDCDWPKEERLTSPLLADASGELFHRVLGCDHPAVAGTPLNVLIFQLVKRMRVSHDSVLFVHRDLSLLNFVKRMHLCRTYHVKQEGLGPKDFAYIADRVFCE